MPFLLVVSQIKCSAKALTFLIKNLFVVSVLILYDNGKRSFICEHELNLYITFVDI